jgi:hypothetical protein
MTCGRAGCSCPVPPERTDYCSGSCARAAKRHRYRRSPGGRAASKRMQARRLKRFVAMTDARKRLVVKPTPAAQAQARALVVAGLVGFEDAAGRIRSVGTPLSPADAGLVIKTNWTPRPQSKATA